MFFNWDDFHNVAEITIKHSADLNEHFHGNIFIIRKFSEGVWTDSCSKSKIRFFHAFIDQKFKEFVETLKQSQRLVKFKGRETERSR